MNKQEVDQIYAFKEAVKKGKFEEQDLESTDGQVSNRGNKLLKGAEFVNRGKLADHENHESVEYLGQERRLFKRRRMDDDYKPAEMDDPTLGVDIEKLLRPITSPRDIVEHPAVKRTYSSQHLRELALSNVLMVEKERENVNTYSKLLEIFLGDFPNLLSEKELRLRDYDHHLHDKDLESVNNSPVVDHTEDDVRLTRSGSTNDDPFFALPELEAPGSLLKKLTTYGDQEENAEEIETTRQLSQIALQRNQEYVRNLMTIRNTIVKCQRIQEKIMAWGNEICGIQEEGVSVPNALVAVKRGIISASTNRAQGEHEEEEDEEE